MDNRGVSPVVGKLLAIGIAVLYIAGTTGILLGGVVPDYRATTGSELGERVLATAAGEIEQSIPATDGRSDVHLTRDLPRTIAGDRYRLVVRNRTLTLDHPDDAVDARTRLSLPPSLTVLNDTWESGDPLVVHVRGRPDNRTLSLMEGSR